uniref:V-SNARE coiled-coil homology domain-containing protein n=1 Tax=Parascaris univalens TaxID=6257 RepID=A0A915C5F9_PARUN
MVLCSFYTYILYKFTDAFNVGGLVNFHNLLRKDCSTESHRYLLCIYFYELCHRISIFFFSYAVKFYLCTSRKHGLTKLASMQFYLLQVYRYHVVKKSAFELLPWSTAWKFTYEY